VSSGGSSARLSRKKYIAALQTRVVREFEARLSFKKYIDQLPVEKLRENFDGGCVNEYDGNSRTFQSWRRKRKLVLVTFEVLTSIFYKLSGALHAGSLPEHLHTRKCTNDCDHHRSTYSYRVTPDSSINILDGIKRWSL